jgi:hypothetical protein
MCATPSHSALYDAKFDPQRPEFDSQLGWSVISMVIYSGLNMDAWSPVSTQFVMGTHLLLLPILLLFFFFPGRTRQDFDSETRNMREI